MEELIKNSLKNNCKVIEVTIKKYYITYSDDTISNEQIKSEWFDKFLNKSHAYKDGCHIGGADELVDIKFLHDKK